MTEQIYNQRRAAIISRIYRLNAIAKSKRDRAGKDEIITELADVSIIVEQMAFFYGEGDFKKEKERKLLRLKERLQKHLNKEDEP